MSQEWDEVVHEVRLMRERLEAFEEDLRAAADGGELTEDQCAFVQVCTAMASYCSLRLLDLCAEVTSVKDEEEGDTQE